VDLHSDLLRTNWYEAAGFEARGREAADLVRKMLFAAMEGICWKMMPLLGHLSTFGLVPEANPAFPSGSCPRSSMATGFSRAWSSEEEVDMY
jgi:hypothetical protein